MYTHWIGWDDLHINDYSPSDREYLISLRKNNCSKNDLLESPNLNFKFFGK